MLAPADGIVEEIIDNCDDNEIGKVNTTNNWGNTIIIRHLPGLYTQMSHLKKGSFKVKIGDFVKRGDLLAHCGNSGRSPVPHLHFQVQATPTLGSRTIDYPFDYYLAKGKQGMLQQFSRPLEGDTVSGIETMPLLKSAFNILPNSHLKFGYVNGDGTETTEQWESFTDAYNYKYLYCSQTESSAYYVNDGSMFYFTAFYGDKESLLYYFYLTAYKVFFGNLDTEVNDAMPLSMIRDRKISIWFHDFVAPFYSYIHVGYSIKSEYTDSPFDTELLVLKSKTEVSVLGKTHGDSTGTITLGENLIQGFTYESEQTKIKAHFLN